MTIIQIINNFYKKNLHFLSLIKFNKFRVFNFNPIIFINPLTSSDIPRAFDSMAYKYPLVMGHEFVAKVIDTGSKVNKFEKGDIVSAFPLIPCSIKNPKKSCEHCDNQNFNLCSDYDYYGSRSDGSFCEVLDVNGPCGGFNLTWAFSSGYLVGKSLKHH